MKNFPPGCPGGNEMNAWIWNSLRGLGRTGHQTAPGEDPHLAGRTGVGVNGISLIVGACLADGDYTPGHGVRKVVLWTESDRDHVLRIGHIIGPLSSGSSGDIFDDHIVALIIAQGSDRRPLKDDRIIRQREGRTLYWQEQVGCRVGRRCGRSW